MEKKFNIGKVLRATLIYILVAAAASCLTLASCTYRPLLTGTTNVSGQTKLSELEQLINTYFVGEADATAMYDGAAEGMIAALGDRWSY